MRVTARLRSARRGDSRGTVVVIVSIFLTAAMGFGALAVDLGRLYVERRRDQNTVDSAAISGSVVNVLAGGSLQVAVDEVLSKVDTDLARTVETADWTSCADPEALARTAASLGLSPATACISFSAPFDQMRVRVPDQVVEGLFGPALGLPELKTRAAATVAVENAGAGAPPFVALSTATKGDFICLRTGGAQSSQPLTLMDGNGPGLPPTPGLRPDPCDETVYEHASANFGTILPHAYLDGCAQREIEKEKAVSIGIDHPLGFYPAPGYVDGAPERLDGASNCTAAFPNTLEIDTGFSAQGLRCAMLSLRNGPNADQCNNEYPRLHQGPFVQSTYKVTNEDQDNAPAWQFLRDKYDLATEGAPASCVAIAEFRDNTSTWDYYDKFDTLTECLDEWETGDPILFDPEISESSRFAFIPQVHEPALVGSKVHIEGFLPIFVQRLYVSASNKPMCDVLDPRLTNWLIHDAGQQFSCGGAADNLDKVASIVLHCGMVDETLCNEESGLPSGAGYDVFDFVLVD